MTWDLVPSLERFFLVFELSLDRSFLDMGLFSVSEFLNDSMFIGYSSGLPYAAYASRYLLSLLIKLFLDLRTSFFDPVGAAG